VGLSRVEKRAQPPAESTFLLLSPRYCSCPRKQFSSNSWDRFNFIYDVFGFIYPNILGLVGSNVPLAPRRGKRTEKGTRHFFRGRINPGNNIVAWAHGFVTKARTRPHKSRRIRSTEKSLSWHADQAVLKNSVYKEILALREAASSTPVSRPLTGSRT
jgi:hypothetical protein